MSTSVQTWARSPSMPQMTVGVEEKADSENTIEKSSLASVTGLAPLVGSFLAHNTTQSLLLRRSVTYFANPVTNYFLNLPIAALAGSVAFFIAKIGLKDSKIEKTSTDLDAVTKAIGWSTVFTTIGAAGLQKVISQSTSVDPISLVLTFVAEKILGSALTEMGFVVASTCISVALISLAEEMFQKDEKKGLS